MGTAAPLEPASYGTINGLTRSRSLIFLTFSSQKEKHHGLSQ